MKFLCAADLHLGRQPSRVPSAVLSSGVELTPAVAWRRLVSEAKAMRVDAVLIAGDVLDDEHDFFEAFGDLQAGVEELVASGVEVLAVSGNHDVEVLPRLAKAVPGLVLLGEGGRWEVRTFDDGTSTVHVAGWSYPSRSVTSSVLEDLPGALAGLAPAPILGLLHCDRDQSASRYLPVSSTELAAAGVDAWLLGHVHRPDVVNLNGAISGYLGSISPADPGEEGGRGAWLLEVAGASRSAALKLSPVPLSPLRYESVELDVSALHDPADVGQAITAALKATHERLRDEYAHASHGVSAVGCRLHLVGRSGIRAELARRLVDEDPRDLLLALEGVTYFVHDVRLTVLPELDMAAVAKGTDPLALVARKLLVLDGPPCEELESLLEQGRAHLAAVAAGRHYRQLQPPDLSDAIVAGHLRQAALALIDLMAEP